MSTAFWDGKRVLVTGHTGFKGGWLVLWLQRLGALVCGIALPPSTAPNLFELARVAEDIDSHFCDICDAERLTTLIHAYQPEIVLHLAAQPLVRASYRDPLATFSSNIMGTAHVLDALRSLESVRVAVMATTDKVYRNLEQPYPYREEDALGGHDPYSASKAASEIVIASYRDAFLTEQGVAVASARAGNVIGGGDWSEDRLIPDAIRAWQANEILDIRRPQAIRPWQHVLDPLHGYLTLAEKLWHHPELAGAYNFGPHTHEAATVREVIELARKAYGKANVSYGDGNSGPHEAGWLALETAKARLTLGLQPRWNLAKTVTHTMAWYQAQHAGADARKLCLTEIANYQSLIKA
ncbi:CDP-glucose 4,6-dehydratase [Laribacter hongkongensis]|uniref:CDP-glucose 4,6-dehydratase n=1 Tax=Laribacter hongkongensis TaxID=168471 RepID=UPI001EFE6D3A|nr:CDP-glucose 4,6-dehydratase [Laribacter hongkongensis]MCG9098084.1 CDP-glucose 4,6-dehydratase [Laribacter hongkongensis]